MQKAYTPKTWKDKTFEGTKPSISASNLNHIEQGIDNNDSRIVQLADAIAALGGHVSNVTVQNGVMTVTKNNGDTVTYNVGGSSSGGNSSGGSSGSVNTARGADLFFDSAATPNDLPTPGTVSVDVLELMHLENTFEDTMCPTFFEKETGNFVVINEDLSTEYLFQRAVDLGNFDTVEDAMASFSALEQRFNGLSGGSIGGQILVRGLTEWLSTYADLVPTLKTKMTCMLGSSVTPTEISAAIDGNGNLTNCLRDIPSMVLTTYYLVEKLFQEFGDLISELGKEEETNEQSDIQNP